MKCCSEQIVMPTFTIVCLNVGLDIIILSHIRLNFVNKIMTLKLSHMMAVSY